MTECFICCTNEGKSKDEIIQDMFVNKKTFGYPVISLDKVYGCNCSNSYAHNKCLLEINKCPTCRKYVSKPNLYVKTKYDYMFGFLFDKIKSNPKIIKRIELICVGLLVISLGILFASDKGFIHVEKNIKSMSILGLLLIFQLMAGTVFAFKDYCKKYWLYDEKTNQIKSL